ncbi:STAS domain-containing protein [Robbsia andropogonis]|uniref:STAS domain-containing protein n=1 Tax=Robbsia andropogonis TaxID=28092 RepID=UPI0004B48C9A|nr:STAS domain-containing protein [Robbsia andropogonis]MCP1117126.1 STAS domain-containing protein [Robbsia andropogonis]MCP1128472.1 STAS domain-containing protein [Robbsia andropogonis]
MQIDQTEQDGWQVMHLNGRLDGTGAPLLEHAIDAYLGDGGRHLVLDLSRLSYISSIGLRVLLMAGKRLARPGPGNTTSDARQSASVAAAGGEVTAERGAKGQLVLASLKANVREVLEMSGFIALFPVIDDLATLQPAAA